MQENRLECLSGSRVAKLYCDTNADGDTFAQCSSATPESRPATRTPPPRPPRSRVRDANGSSGRKPPEGVETRPELHRLIDQLRKGDVLVVWKLDRLSRSLRDVLTIMERLGEAKAGFRSLTEAIDTTTAAGRIMMQMVGAFAEFERAMLRERTRAGLESAREDGRIGGWLPKLSDMPKGI